MAEENTTDLTPTPTDESQTPAAGSGSSTTANPNPQPQADGDDAEPGTILTDAPAKDDAEPKADEPAKDDAEPNAFLGAPEGEYELTGLPEGTVIDKEALDVVAPIAKEIGLSNEGLSKIAGVYAEKILPRVAETVTGDLQQQITATHKQWATDAAEMIKTDKVFEGKQITEVQQVAAKTLDRFGGEEFRTFLNDSGLGNHPAMIRFAYLAGTAISEDTTFERGGPAPAAKSSVEKFYGAK